MDDSGFPVRAVVLLLACCFALRAGAGERASAPDPATIAESRAHFARGRAHYLAGRVGRAVEEFKAGFDLVPRPLFMLNLGQAYRRLGDLSSARESYRRFLELAPRDDPERPSVAGLLETLNAQLGAAEPRVENAPAPTPAPRVVVAPVTDVSRPPALPSKRSALRRYWWTIPTASVVAVTAVGLGVYFGLRRSDDGGCADYSYGCATITR